MTSHRRCTNEKEIYTNGVQRSKTQLLHTCEDRNPSSVERKRSNSSLFILFAIIVANRSIVERENDVIFDSSSLPASQYKRFDDFLRFFRAKRLLKMIRMRMNDKSDYSRLSDIEVMHVTSLDHVHDL